MQGAGHQHCAAGAGDRHRERDYPAVGNIGADGKESETRRGLFRRHGGRIDAGREGVRGMADVFVAAAVAFLVSMTVVKANFWRIDRYVAETTTALQEAAKRLEERFSLNRRL